METYQSRMSAQFSALLARREADLRALVGSSTQTLVPPGTQGLHEVQDFKELASEQTLAVVDDAKIEHSARELELIPAALRRLHDGSYGTCVDCGDPIDLRRLSALPATPYCTACQAVHEQGEALASRH